MTGQRYLVVERKVNRGNRRDVEDLRRLTMKGATLNEAGMKKLVRLQTRLMKEGVIVPYTRDQARTAMVEAYKAFPLWKRASLRVRFHGRQALKWLQRQWAKFQLWWVSR